MPQLARLGRRGGRRGGVRRGDQARQLRRSRARPPARPPVPRASRSRTPSLRRGSAHSRSTPPTSVHSCASPTGAPSRRASTSTRSRPGWSAGIGAVKRPGTRRVRRRLQLLRRAAARSRGGARSRRAAGGTPASRTSTLSAAVSPTRHRRHGQRHRLGRRRHQPAAGLPPERLEGVVRSTAAHPPAPRRLAGEHHRPAVAVALHGDERPRRAAGAAGDRQHAGARAGPSRAPSSSRAAAPPPTDRAPRPASCRAASPDGAGRPASAPTPPTASDDADDGAARPSAIGRRHRHQLFERRRRQAGRRQRARAEHQQAAAALGDEVAHELELGRARADRRRRWRARWRRSGTAPRASTGSR